MKHLPLTLLLALLPTLAQAQTNNQEAKLLPTVPPGFTATLFAREPLVRQPCSMAFDSRGRLHIGMGPQYRHPKPDTPADSVVIVLDTDGDGRADHAKTFATGFNAIQGLAWRGRDLWIANSPDLTLVRDLDGDDEADEYIRVYTDLGNLEHGLHGLNWAPDGKLYMSKGNSKGLTKPGRVAPLPFRQLWGVKSPAGAPDFPAPQVFNKNNYQHAYHDPADDWGREGGVLRCDDLGRNLEIVSRGFRNPWDISFDTGFNWLGTDNDQNEGDRVFMPFYGAHFGWNHSWSSHWQDDEHPPTAPVSGPIFEGSGTGVIFADTPQLPATYRGVWFINDWLQKTTFVYRPRWDGALLRPAGGDWEPFAIGAKTLFRPTDLEIGPDGALWILGWGAGYGAQFNNGQLSNEGRVFRIAWNDAPPLAPRAHADKPLASRTVADLIADFDGPLPVWRTDAQEELVRRGPKVKADLLAALDSGLLSQAQETWTLWTLGRIAPTDSTIDAWLTRQLEPAATPNLNRQIQSLRILAHRIRHSGHVPVLTSDALAMLESAQPRLRCAAVQAIVQARQSSALPQLLELLAAETDRVTFYSAWQALRELIPADNLRPLVEDKRAGVRRGALLALLESNALDKSSITPLATDPDPATREIALLRLGLGVVRRSSKPGSRAVEVAAADSFAPSLVRSIQVKSRSRYLAVPGGLQVGAIIFTDRDYLLKGVPEPLLGADYIRTANADDGSGGDDFLSFEALLPVRVHVAIDSRIPQPPAWVRENFRTSEFKIEADHWTYQLYSRDFPAGPVTLGGNTGDGKSGGKSHYLIAIELLPLQNQPQPAPIDAALAALDKADPIRGELLFKHARGLGCTKCHSLGERKNSFGPELTGIGLRANARHIVQSIVEPSALITEGFTLQVVETTDGKTHSGVLLEESGLTLTLGLTTGEPLILEKEKIESRVSSKQSAMPLVAQLLTPQQVADVAAFVLAQRTPPKSASNAPDGKQPNGNPAPDSPAPADPKPVEPQPVEPKTVASADGFGYQLQADHLLITHSGKPVADYVFRHEKILRPFFANCFAPDGTKLTRNFPPVAGQDSSDHHTMHPGVWLGLGDVSGTDFWRNRGRIEHLAFIAAPAGDKDAFDFATESRLLSADGQEICRMVNRYAIHRRPTGWLLLWDATFRSDRGDFTFGDQEEMGFGARVATPIAEQKGGVLVTSRALQTAKASWGQPAEWTDYSGVLAGQPSGITLMAAPGNFRPSWWHNRDYGVFVANPFGRAAMRQGARSLITVKRGESFRIRFAAALHRGPAYDPTTEYKHYLDLLK